MRCLSVCLSVSLSESETDRQTDIAGNRIYFLCCHCLSVSKSYSKTHVYLDEILPVDRRRDMDELINF